MTYPKDFLIALSTQQHQTKYARITALDINEMPLEEIKGKITGGGPVSIDGNSAVRRTCSLTMVADKSTAGTAAANDITNPYWALTNKFKLEVGLLNTINPSYPDIIWINQGIYAITSFSKSISQTSITISISGKDKMTLLNGEMGGLFSTSTTLDTMERQAKDGSIILEKRPIYNIIYDLLHLYSGEPEHNIIINDLDAYGYELWDYRGSKSNGEAMPMYIFREYDNDGNEIAIRNITLDGDKIVYRITESDATSTLVYDVAYDMATSSIIFINSDDEATSTISQSEQIALKNIIASQLYSKIDGINEVGGVNFILGKGENPKKYKIQKIEYGDTAGYYQTELVYPGDLIMNAGEAVTAALDKIKSVLGDFEYFYDIDGKFIFQKKKIYVNNLFSPINGDTIEPFVEISPYTYDFEDDRLFTAISDSPVIGNIKNDFTIWGNKRNSNGGDKLPIHARYAIDKKPTRYTTFDYYTKVNDLTYLIFESAQAINTKGEDQNQTSNTIVNYYINDKNEIIISSIKTPQGAIDGLYKIEDNNYIKASNEEIKEWCSNTDSNTLYSLILTDVKGQATDENVYKIENEKFTIAPSEDYYKKENNKFVKTDDLSNLEEYYRLKEGTTTYCAEGCREEDTDIEVDWRELIWLMQRDYYQHNLDPDFTITLIKNNEEFAAARRTGYEQYYADMQGFWRKLYNPDGEAPTYITDKDDESIRKYKHWNRAILLYPQTLDFWIDFLDTGGPLDDYSVKAIGCRPKIEQANSSGVTAIFYRETPDVEFIILPQEQDKLNNTEDDSMSLQQIYIQDNMKELFNISSQGKASNARADELIWQYACGSETVNFTCIPLYFLEPNTQIRYKGEDYIITKISVPLTYNGTMSLTTTKIIRPF